MIEYITTLTVHTKAMPECGSSVTLSDVNYKNAKETLSQLWDKMSMDALTHVGSTVIHRMQDA